MIKLKLTKLRQHQLSQIRKNGANKFAVAHSETPRNYWALVVWADLERIVNERTFSKSFFALTK